MPCSPVRASCGSVSRHPLSFSIAFLSISRLPSRTLTPTGLRLRITSASKLSVVCGYTRKRGGERPTVLEMRVVMGSKRVVTCVVLVLRAMPRKAKDIGTGGGAGEEGLVVVPL